MMTIENELLKIAVRQKGAELAGIYHKKNQLEYLWSGDPAFWGKQSPVLFPIVGTLKNDTYFFNGNAYRLGRHGFARDSEFELCSRHETSANFTLTSNENTLKLYPFPFRFTIGYSLSENQLTVSYTVINSGKSDLYFSVGGHPAFRVPQDGGAGYEDYYLEFGNIENTGRWPISKEGLIETAPAPLLKESKRLPLSKSLFDKDALVFKDLRSRRVALLSDKSPHGLSVDFSGFPYLGIWAAKNADFVCIEPWCGIADSVNSSQQLTAKEGIERLAAGGIFERSWKVELF
jgi:galactose mutarotase-like enzyme